MIFLTIVAIIVLAVVTYMSIFQTHASAMEIGIPPLTDQVSSAGVTGTKGITWRQAPWWTFEKNANHYVTTIAGNGIRLTLEKTFARPGERWNEVMVDILVPPRRTG